MWIRRAGYLVLSLMFVLMTSTITAQETYTWEPYDFTVTLPAGWQVADSNSDDLLLMDSASDALVRVTLIPDLDAVEGIAQSIRSFIPVSPTDMGRAEITIDGETYETIAELPTIGGRQVLIIQLETYMITASAPVEQWDAFYPTLETIISGIDAGPSFNTTLTQRIAWRDIEFMAPSDWDILYSGLGSGYRFGAWGTALEMNQAARIPALMMDMRDVSLFRDILDQDSLPVLRTQFFVGGEAQLGQIESSEMGDLTIYSADFEGELLGQLAGHAMLVVGDEYAYLIVGMATADVWEASERDLFVAIIETMQFE